MMVDSHEQVALNFYPLEDQDFSFSVYRCAVKQIQSEILQDSCKQRKLPTEFLSRNSHESASYENYWVSYQNTDGFEQFYAQANTNNYLTQDYLFHVLSGNCQRSLEQDEFIFPKSKFEQRIGFILGSYSEGKEVVWLQPYFLKVKHKFGFLADFRFERSDSFGSHRKVQELSLSTKNGKQNKDFYADQFKKISLFWKKFIKRLFPLVIDQIELSILQELEQLDSNLLSKKVYLFQNLKASNNQFSGLKQFGPLTGVRESSKIYFIYEENRKKYSYDLYRALRGDTFQTFPGMEKMFGFGMGKENVGGIQVQELSIEQVKIACSSIEKDMGHGFALPIVITPFRLTDNQRDDKSYYSLKHTFLSYGLSSQFVSLDMVRRKESLKWSVSNIGLQIFSKIGGQPWCVQPRDKKCLIIGIGQSYSKEAGRTKKYFAYSILTDSSGIYKDLKVISSINEQEYLNGFRNNILNSISEYSEQYDDFVIHASFSIKRKEIEIVKEIANQKNEEFSQTSKNITVLKFNRRKSMIGYSISRNSMTPYEGSFLKISGSEYLVWFDGFPRTRKSLTKRPQLPVHVCFLYTGRNITPAEKEAYLQDAVNLSGTNWRGFNGKSMPISIYYAKIISEHIKAFERFDLEEIDFNTILPWFL